MWNGSEWFAEGLVNIADKDKFEHFQHQYQGSGLNNLH